MRALVMEEFGGPFTRVTVNFYITCGRCQFCREGRDTLCQGVRLGV